MSGGYIAWSSNGKHPPTQHLTGHSLTVMFTMPTGLGYDLVRLNEYTAKMLFVHFSSYLRKVTRIMFKHG